MFQQPKTNPTYTAPSDTTGTPTEPVSPAASPFYNISRLASSASSSSVDPASTKNGTPNSDPSENTPTTDPSTPMSRSSESIFKPVIEQPTKRKNDQDPDKFEQTDNPYAIRVLIRTPITQLLEKDKPAVEKVVKAIGKVIAQLQREGNPIYLIEHEVLTNSTQQINLQTKETPAEFRAKRIKAVRDSDVFIEITLASSLSVSGGVEHGYALALRDFEKRSTPEDLIRLNTISPARVFEGSFSRGLVIMHSGEKSFGGELVTTLYKQDPDLDYVYIKYEGEMVSQDLGKKFPGIQTIEFTDDAMHEIFRNLFEKYLREKQQLVREKSNRTVPLTRDITDIRRDAQMRPMSL